MYFQGNADPAQKLCFVGYLRMGHQPAEWSRLRAIRCRLLSSLSLAALRSLPMRRGMASVLPGKHTVQAKGISPLPLTRLQPKPSPLDPRPWQMAQTWHSLCALTQSRAAGDGARGCPGWRFAVEEAKIALYHMFKDFSFTLAPGQQPLALSNTITLSPKTGVFVQVQRRAKGSQGFAREE